ncbi:type II CAAX endopeptidase family protein [Paenibacillus arenosi]|uniref:CPBP family intramembrane glutamic endopeptidase n=1 Tax=Paenibacillus arenosi TaxID=2774142 RepID=UPI003080C9B0
MLIAFAFVLSVIVVQITPLYVGACLALLLLVGSMLATHDYKIIWLTSFVYVVGYWLSFYLKYYILALFVGSSEAEIVLSRLSLLGFIIPYFLLWKWYKPHTNYLFIGNFSNTIRTPFIWRGIQDPIWRFLLIATTIILISFSFIIDYGQEEFYRILLFGCLFALVNAVLEEIVWRGLILPRFVDFAGEKLGLVIASVGFGFYHYSIGFPWAICALFSLFGMLMGGVAIRSQGLLPVTILHFIMNVCFAMIGVIFK